MIHAVPLFSGTLTADCGAQLGKGDNTGHFRPLRSFDGEPICEACQPPIEEEELF